MQLACDLHGVDPLCQEEMNDLSGTLSDITAKRPFENMVEGMHQARSSLCGERIHPGSSQR